MKAPLEILKNKFGYSSFRNAQENIITSILNKQDTLVLMPTGGGKSLCYQIPALIFDGLTVVVSPLIALMKDQVDALKLNGIPAAYFNSTLSASEQNKLIKQLQKNEIKLLYLAPERLVGAESGFLNFLKSLNVDLFAIDEAHCISHWGHDFRPEYSMLSRLREVFKGVPVMALTATADKLTRKDIAEKLHLQSPKIFISSFDRKNISYKVAPKRNSFGKLLDFLGEHREDAGIIYVLSRASTEDLAERLNDEGFSAKPYHAGLNREVREQHQDMFLRDEVKIIVATIAFGMGIDKSNVRFVVHMDLPKNIESYYQETGRAGRDGLKSSALLFYSYADVVKLKSFIEIEGNAIQTQVLEKKLNEMAEFGDLRTCRRKYILNYFDEEADSYCGNCDICLTDVEKFDGTLIAQKALSAIARLEERFGVSYVIDFLRGSQSAKIWDQHKQLKTYGVGAEISKEDWRRYINDLMHLGYLQKEDGKYPLLKLTEKSWPVLHGKENVMLIATISDKEAVEEANVTAYDNGLFTVLKTLRNQLAQKEGVPAYIIFSDSTLQELATYLPEHTSQLRQISGFGEVKTEKYGKLFLKKITGYMEENNLTSRMTLKNPKKFRNSRKTKSKRSKEDTKAISFNLYQEGNSIEEIARLRELNASTIMGHLSHFILEGNLEIHEFVSKEKVHLISKAVALHGDAALNPIKNEVGDAVTYGDIRMVINHLKRKHSI